MKHFLLFDSDCSLCRGLAAAVERESDGLLIAKSLRDQEMLRILERVRPTWKHEPTLLRIQDDKAEAFTGFAMRVHLIAVLGPQRAYRVAKVVQRFGVSATGFELSRRVFFSYSGKVLAGIALLGIPGVRNLEPVTSRPQTIPPTDDLQPGVKEFIANNFLGHAAEYPDPNEQVEPLRAYLESAELLRAEKVDEAITPMQATVEKYPESRHVHAGLGYALYTRYEKSKSEDDLRDFVRELLEADKIGLEYGRVPYTTIIALGLGKLRDIDRLDVYFQQAINAPNRVYRATLDYARGLALMNDPRTDEWFGRAMEIEPTGIGDAVAYYAEWLLDQGENESVIKLINEQVNLNYAHFLKGVALEKTRKFRKAKKEYEKYREMSVHFPASLKYRIQGSEQQRELFFEGDPPLIRNTETDPDDDDAGTDAEQAAAKELLAIVIASEAESESHGAQRAVAWTVRTRVFRAYFVPTTCGGYGNPNNGAWAAREETAKLAAKYNAICNAPGQFNTIRVPATPTSRQVANDVWAGWVPDPVVRACLKGDMQPHDDPCGGGCTERKKSGAFASGPAWIHAAEPNGSGGTKACPNCHPRVGCNCYIQSPMKPCFNGGVNENCFWRIL